MDRLKWITTILWKCIIKLNHDSFRKIILKTALVLQDFKIFKKLRITMIVYLNVFILFEKSD